MHGLVLAVSEIALKGIIALKKRYGEILKAMYSLPQLKLFVKKKTADTVGDTTEFTVAVDNDKPSTSVKVGTKTPSDCNKINYWDPLPNEWLEKILPCAMKEYGLQTC